VAVTSDGLDYSYSHHSGKRNFDCSLSSLYQLGRSLAGKGLIRETNIQDGTGAIRICRQAIDQFDIAALHVTGQAIAFGNEAFAVQANPHGDWTLSNPAKTVRRLSGGENVGHIPSLMAAFELAIDRSFKASNQTIDYAGVNAAYLALAQCLLSGVSLVSLPHDLAA
jgi:hypothetical protein